MLGASSSSLVDPLSLLDPISKTPVYDLVVETPVAASLASPRQPERAKALLPDPTNGLVSERASLPSGPSSICTCRMRDSSPSL